ncbi:MAG: AmmeMemoRadiSam system protein B [Nitrososphaerales archaeon]|nr:AmmeMemoRadiSam system protein B [Nitrososphaerales archaeon]
MPIRRPAVAGSFYPAEPEELRRLIRDSFVHPLGPGRLPPSPETADRLVAVVAPHAGYVYSGPVAAHSYLHVSSLRRPDLIVIVAPNHYGIGSGVSAYKSGEWETPLGRMKVDEAAVEELASETGIVDFDPAAHQMEHSLEVQLPFLQTIYGDSVPFVPVSISFQDLGTTKALADGVAKLAKTRKTVLVASSDLTHYEPADEARRKDMALISEVEKIDPEGFYSTLTRLEVTACGFGAISTIMQAAKLLGLRRGELLKYASSGDTTGDKSQVVGYGSLRFV